MFTKTIWVERDETDPDYAGKDWDALDDMQKESVLEKALEEINCGDAPVTPEDLTKVRMMDLLTE